MKAGATKKHSSFFVAKAASGRTYEGFVETL